MQQNNVNQNNINHKKSKVRRWLGFAEKIKEVLVALLVVMLVTEFVMAHSVVPSGSMIPTIQIGDHLITNRLPYYYRDPTKGEVVVFKEDEELLVKRVIGLPGDKIDIRDNKVWVNDEAIDEMPYIYIWESTWQVAGSSQHYPYKVPEGHYFVMGDNRPESLDSRYFGAVDRRDIVAKAFVRIYPLNKIGLIR